MAKSQQTQLSLLTFVLFGALCCNFSPSASASEKLNSSFRYSSDKTLQIDTTLTLRLTFKWTGNEIDYRFSVASVPIQNLELIRIGQSSKKEKNFVIKEFEYEFKALALGEASVQDFKLTYVSAEDPGGLSIPIQGKHFKIISRRKFSALWLISLIILPISFLASAFIRRKYKKSTEVSHGHKADETAEEKALRQLEQIDSHSSAQQKLNAVSRIFDNYQKERRACVSRDLNSEDERELKQLVRELEEARFSGNRLTENNYQNILNRIASFIKKHKIIEPS